MPPGQEDSHRDSGESTRKKESSSRFSAQEMGKRAKSIGSLGIIPIILAVGPIIGAVIGQWLDKKFETDPWLTVVFVIFGFVAAVREMIRLLKRSQESEDND